MEEVGDGREGGWKVMHRLCPIDDILEMPLIISDY